MSELQLELMMSYYTGTGDVTRSKLTLTWESEPPYYLQSRNLMKMKRVCSEATIWDLS